MVKFREVLGEEKFKDRNRATEKVIDLCPSCKEKMKRTIRGFLDLKFKGK